MQISIFQSQAYLSGHKSPYAIISSSQESSVLPFSPNGWQLWLVATADPDKHSDVIAAVNDAGFWLSS